MSLIGRFFKYMNIQLCDYLDSGLGRLVIDSHGNFISFKPVEDITEFVKRIIESAAPERINLINHLIKKNDVCIRQKELGNFDIGATFSAIQSNFQLMFLIYLTTELCWDSMLNTSGDIGVADLIAGRSQYTPYINEDIMANIQTVQACEIGTFEDFIKNNPQFLNILVKMLSPRANKDNNDKCIHDFFQFSLAALFLHELSHLVNPLVKTLKERQSPDSLDDIYSEEMLCDKFVYNTIINYSVEDFSEKHKCELKKVVNKRMIGLGVFFTSIVLFGGFRNTPTHPGGYYRLSTFIYDAASCLDYNLKPLYSALKEAEPSIIDKFGTLNLSSISMSELEKEVGPIFYKNAPATFWNVRSSMMLLLFKLNEIQPPEASNAKDFCIKSIVALKDCTNEIATHATST